MLEGLPRGQQEASPAETVMVKPSGVTFSQTPGPGRMLNRGSWLQDKGEAP